MVESLTMPEYSVPITSAVIIYNEPGRRSVITTVDMLLGWTVYPIVSVSKLQVTYRYINIVESFKSQLLVCSM